MVAGWNPFLFLKHRFHILHFPNSTGLSTKPTGRHYTKYRFSPHIGQSCQSGHWVSNPNDTLCVSVRREVLGIVGRDPNVSKSNRMNVDIFGFFMIQYEVYSTDSSKMFGDFPEVLNFQPINSFSNSTGSSVIPVHCSVFPMHADRFSSLYVPTCYPVCTHTFNRSRSRERDAN